MSNASTPAVDRGPVVYLTSPTGCATAEPSQWNEPTSRDRRISVSAHVVGRPRGRCAAAGASFADKGAGVKLVFLASSMGGRASLRFARLSAPANGGLVRQLVAESALLALVR